MLISLSPVFAQTKSNSSAKWESGNEVFNGRSIGFSIIPYIVDKTKATSFSGTYHLNTLYMNGFEAGPDYRFNFSRSYSLMVGFHAGAAARNFKMIIPKTDFKPNLQFDVDEWGAPNRQWDFYASFPIWIEKRWILKDNNFCSVIAGANIRFYPIRYYGDEVEIYYPDVNGNQIPVLKIDATIGNNLRPWINYNIGGGYALLLKNNNFLQCNLVANFSTTKIVNGTYTINVTGKPQSTGSYSANLSYIGLSFSYIFTGANKRLRKMYENDLKSKK